MDNIRNKVLEEIDKAFMGIDRGGIGGLVKSVLEAERIFVHGERREDIPMQGFCMRLNHLGLTAFHIGDVYTPEVQEKDLLVVSCTSPHPDVDMVYMRAAAQAGAKVILLTDSADNQACGLADSVITIPIPGADGQTASVQSGGSLYVQVLWLMLDFAELLLQDFVGGDEKQRVSRHANIL